MNRKGKQITLEPETQGNKSHRLRLTEPPKK